jgi:hypothetical protein
VPLLPVACQNILPAPPTATGDVAR